MASSVKYTADGYPFVSDDDDITAAQEYANSLRVPTTLPGFVHTPKPGWDAQLEEQQNPLVFAPAVRVGVSGAKRLLAGEVASPSEIGNRLTGANDTERFQTWPEQLVRSGFSLPHDVVTGEVPVMQGEHTSSELIHRAQDLSGLMGGGSVAGTGAKPANSLGVFGGARAKTANLEKLAQAKKMESDGFFSSDIWDKTGWFKGTDGQWRFEIPDNALAVQYGSNIHPEDLKGSGIEHSLNVVRHDKLFDAYPELLNSIVTIQQGKFGGQFGLLDGNPNIRITAKDLKDVRTIAAHELQHAVQNIEGFSAGASMDVMRRVVNMAVPKKILDNLTAVQKDNLIYEMYKRNAGETEARNVQKRLDYTPNERSALPPNYTQDVATELQSVRNPHSVVGASMERRIGNEQRATEQGFNIDAYHGTNQPVAHFDTERLGSSTRSSSSKEAAWFTDSPDVAGGYAENAAKRVIADIAAHEKKYKELERRVNQTEKIAQRTGKNSDWDANADAVAALENHEMGAIRAEPSGQNILPVKLKLNNPAVFDAEGGGILALKAKTGLTFDQIIKKAKQDGHDGVIFKNLDDNPDGVGKPATHYAIFDPANIRSKFARFDPKDAGKSGLLLSDTSANAPLSALAKAPVFYSAVEHALKNSRTKTASAEQWLGELRNQPGVKQEELDWVLHELPKGQITKAELEWIVNEHKVELKEVSLGDTVSSADVKKFYESYNIGIPWNDLTAREVAQWTNKANKSPRTKYSQWQLPGGSNYREMLLTLPQKMKQSFEEWSKERGYGDHPGSRNLYEKFQEGLAVEPGTGYRSTHWPNNPNVLAHIRMNDRDIPGVGKSLHIEEIQSDWHQAGRKQGYKGEREKLKPKFDAIEKKIMDSNDESILADPELDNALKTAVAKKIITADEAKLYQRYSQIDAAQEISDKVAVPDAPLKTTWADLGLKRMIRQAAENGYDAVSWTPGEAQAKRYPDALRQEVKGINWETKQNGPDKYDGTSKYVVIDGKADRLWAKVDNKGNIIDQSHSTLKGKKLDDVIGKDMAKRILEQDKGELEPKDFVIGAEGMKGFYDKMLVDKANAIAKKFGGKVEQANTRVGNLSDEELALIDNPRNYEKGKSQTIHVLRITPQLRNAAINKGFSLFADTGKVGAPLAALTKVEHNPFTTDAYHGGPKPFVGTDINTPELFSTSNSRLAGGNATPLEGGYARTNRPLSENKGSHVMPLKLNTSDYHVIDAKGKSWQAINHQAIFEANQLNKPGVIVKNVVDSPDAQAKSPNTIYITLDASTARGRFAKFDPDKFGESGLLKAGGLPIYSDENGNQLLPTQKGLLRLAPVSHNPFKLTPVKGNPFAPK